MLLRHGEDLCSRHQHKLCRQGPSLHYKQLKSPAIQKCLVLEYTSVFLSKNHLFPLFNQTLYKLFITMLPANRVIFLNLYAKSRGALPIKQTNHQVLKQDLARAPERQLIFIKVKHVIRRTVITIFASRDQDIRRGLVRTHSLSNLGI